MHLAPTQTSYLDHVAASSGVVTPGASSHSMRKSSAALHSRASYTRLSTLFQTYRGKSPSRAALTLPSRIASRSHPATLSKSNPLGQAEASLLRLPGPALVR